MLDWNEMVVYVKVVERGSFVGAAADLGIPKSTVSRRVAALEKRLGARLLHRTTRVVRTTPVGQSYFERCAPLIAAAAEAESLVTSAQQAPQGRLRLTTSVLFGQRWLTPVIVEYMQRYPRVEVDLVLLNRLVDLVDEGFDLAIRAGTMGEGMEVARRLGPMAMALVAAPALMKDLPAPREPADLAQLPCIQVGQDDRAGVWALDGHRVAVRGRVRVNDMTVARDLAVAGLGLALVPSFLVGEDLAAGRLVRLLPGVRRDHTALYAVYPSRRFVAPTVRAFVDLCQARFGERAPWLLPDDPEP